MKHQIFAVYDLKTKEFDRPFAAPNPVAAERGFTEIANDPNHPIGQYPDDFKLFRVALMHPETGVVEGETQPLDLGLARKFVRQPQLFDKNRENNAT